MDSIYVPHAAELFWTIKLVLTIKFPEIPVTNLINLRKIKGWRNHGVTQSFSAW